MVDTEVAALTSYSTRPLNLKIQELAKRGIRTIDLYCFCPEDLRILSARQRTSNTPCEDICRLDPVMAATKISAWCKHAEGLFPGDPLDICGIASFFPAISSSDPTQRNLTVNAMKWLVWLMKELREKEFSCDTFEIVGGHTIQQVPKGTVCMAAQLDTGPDVSGTYLCTISETACLENLVGSLDVLQKEINNISWPVAERSRSKVPMLAIEVEPSISRLIHDQDSIRALLPAVKPCAAVHMNLDVGHMRIVDISIKDVGEWAKSVIHCHVSDNARSHFADLEVGAFMSNADCQAWLKSLLAWRNEGFPFLGRFSIEREACGSADKVAACHRKIVRWLKGLSAN